MDLAALPKLAAALVGANVATALPRPANPADAVMLKLEWIQTGGGKRSENLVLRAAVGRSTTVRNVSRTIEAEPTVNADGSCTVDLRVSTVDHGVPTLLDTSVHLGNGETVVVMGSTTKDGKTATERLLFLTVNSVGE